MKKVMFAMAAIVGGIMMISCSSNCTCTAKAGDNEVKVTFSDKQLQEAGVTCAQMQDVLNVEILDGGIAYTCKK